MEQLIAALAASGLDLHSIVVALVPMITSGLVFALVAGIKRLEAIKFSDNYRGIVRILAAVLSFSGVAAGAIATGQTVDHSAVNDIVTVVVQGLLAYMGSTGLHTLKNG